MPMRLRWVYHQLMLRQSMGFYQDEFSGRVAAKVMQRMLESCKGLTYTENTVRILSALNDDSRAQIGVLAQELLVKAN